MFNTLFWTSIAIFCFCLLSMSHLTYSFLSLIVLDRRGPFSISCNVSLVVVNSFSFYMSGKAFISSSHLKGNFGAYIIFGWWFHSFNNLNIWFTISYPIGFLLEKSNDNLMVSFICYCLFSLSALRILYLSLIFDSFNITCFVENLFGLR